MSAIDPVWPLEWHPAYRNKTYLLDWLELRGDYARSDVIRLPFPRKIRFAEVTSEAELCSAEPSFITRTLTRHHCWGGAPYVGEPFVYVWNVGIDDLGRAIAGDVRIQYTQRHVSAPV